MSPRARCTVLPLMPRSAATVWCAVATPRPVATSAASQSARATLSSVPAATRASRRCSSPAGVARASISASNQAAPLLHAGIGPYAPSGAGKAQEARPIRDRPGGGLL